MIAIWNLFFFLVLIGILVTVHEYGHYIVAKKCGVKVLKFSIGFGKSLWSRTDKHGTEFVIAMIPLGGYVRMLDSRMDSVSNEEIHLAFNHKPVLSRIAVVLAGPVFNLIFAVFAFWLMFLIGVTSISPQVSGVIDNSIAQQAGMSEGRLISVNGHKTGNWQDVQIELSSVIGDEQVEIGLQYSPTEKPQHFQLDTSAWQPQPEKQSLDASLGIKRYRPEIKLEIAAVAADSPAYGKVEVNDKIVALNGIKPDTWHAFSQVLSTKPNESVRLTIERSGEVKELLVTLGVRSTGQSEVGFLGVVPKSEPWPESMLLIEQYGLVDGFVKATQKTWRTIILSFEMVGKLITGSVSLNALSGPVSIAEGAGTTAGIGLVYFLSFMAFISINLGIINLMPLPMLDGGHLMFYIIELISGRQVPEKFQEYSFRMGAALIFGIMSIAIFNDLSRL